MGTKSSSRTPPKKKKIRPSRAAALMSFESLTAMTERTLVEAATKVRTQGSGQATEAMVELLSASADCLDQAEAMVRSATRMRVALIRAQLSVGMTMEDIGAVHGLSRQRISQLLKNNPAQIG